MAVPTHFKFTIRGHFKDTPEQWSFGFHMTRDNPAGADANYGDIDEGAVTSAFATMFNTPYFSNVVEATDWRCYQIGTNGKMETPSPLLVTLAPNEVRGGSSNAPWPFQVAMCCTLVAPLPGPARLGRFFLPGITQAITADGRWSTGVVTTYQGLATGMLKDVSDAIDLELTNQAEGCNVSHGPAGSSTGTLQIIDHMEVGRVPDTQRRRRNALVEDPYVGAHIDW